MTYVVRSARQKKIGIRLQVQRHRKNAIALQKERLKEGKVEKPILQLAMRILDNPRG